MRYSLLTEATKMTDEMKKGALVFLALIGLAGWVFATFALDESKAFAVSILNIALFAPCFAASMILKPVLDG